MGKLVKVNIRSDKNQKYDKEMENTINKFLSIAKVSIILNPILIGEEKQISDILLEFINNKENMDNCVIFMEALSGNNKLEITCSESMEGTFEFRNMSLFGVESQKTDYERSYTVKLKLKLLSNIHKITKQKKEINMKNPNAKLVFDFADFRNISKNNSFLKTLRKVNSFLHEAEITFLCKSSPLIGYDTVAKISIEFGVWSNNERFFNLFVKWLECDFFSCHICDADTNKRFMKLTNRFVVEVKGGFSHHSNTCNYEITVHFNTERCEEEKTEKKTPETSVKMLIDSGSVCRKEILKLNEFFRDSKINFRCGNSTEYITEYAAKFTIESADTEKNLDMVELLLNSLEKGILTFSLFNTADDSYMYDLVNAKLDKHKKHEIKYKLRDKITSEIWVTFETVRKNEHSNLEVKTMKMEPITDETITLQSVDNYTIANILNGAKCKMEKPNEQVNKVILTFDCDFRGLSTMKVTDIRHSVFSLIVRNESTGKNVLLKDIRIEEIIRGLSILTEKQMTKIEVVYAEEITLDTVMKNINYWESIRQALDS